MKNRFKIFLGIVATLLLLNCAKEQEILQEQEIVSVLDNRITKQLEAKFSKDYFLETLPYDYTVTWEDGLKSYSDELELNYYEFPIVFTSDLNPDVLNKNRKEGYFNKYKIVVTEEDESNFTFFVSRFHQNIHTTNNFSSKVSFSTSKDYDGLVHLLNKEDEMVYAKRIENGEIIDSKAFFEKKEKGSSLTERVEESCMEVPIHQYMYYYNVRENNVPELYRIQYLGIRYEKSCEYNYFPETRPITDLGGSGTYRGAGPAPYAPCDGECLHKVVVEEDKIDDKKLKPCMKTIVKDLKSLKKGVAHVVAKFSGKTPGYNWKLEDGSLSGGTGSTDPPASYNKSTGTITTTFDSQAWKNATDLSWARTILHESIHADLAVSFKISKPNWIATYPKMVAEWGKLQNWNDVHHEEIARSIVKDVAISLEEYGKAKGYKLSSQFYKDMAWGGLHTTSTFKALPTADKKRILDIIAVELTGMNTNGNSKTQKGKKAGC